MKTKTSELTGAALDWAVAKCEGKTDGELVTHDEFYWDGEGLQWAIEYTPSTNWSQGGPIIEREKLILGYIGEIWECRYFDEGKFKNCEYGPTPLIAAMRCFVTSRLGEEVEVPDELLGE